MYKKKIHLHFVGIGGIGMSGIAKILRGQGYEISGCDACLEQRSIKELQELKCEIYKGNNTKYCKRSDIDILVYSSAIKENNPEILSAQANGIPTIPRSLMLAELMRTKYSIAIAGSHGKTTTSSIISHILIESKKDPTVIIGGHLKNISTNARLGMGDFLVAEADESDRSLLNLQATLAILTNIDLEHLETYSDLKDIKETFVRFLNNLPFYGKAIVCIDDENIRSILPLPHIKIIKYGIEKQVDLYADNIALGKLSSTFSVYKHKKMLGTIQINIPGKHNILNTLAAIALSLELEIPFNSISKALSNFKGVERRFSYKGKFNGAKIFDDYGHHPKEIEKTLEIARNNTDRNLTVIFQPHRYSRTSKLWKKFIETFIKNPIDNLIITDIYPASEQPIPQVTSVNLINAIKKAKPNIPIQYIPYDNKFYYLKKKITEISAPKDLILFLGAGRLNLLADILIKNNKT